MHFKVFTGSSLCAVAVSPRSLDAWLFMDFELRLQIVFGAAFVA
jgi:hypothetical protein